MYGFLVMAFEVCIANRYKFNKKYRKLQLKAAANPDDIALQNSVTQSTVRENDIFIRNKEVGLE